MISCSAHFPEMMKYINFYQREELSININKNFVIAGHIFRASKTCHQSSKPRMDVSLLSFTPNVTPHTIMNLLPLNSINTQKSHTCCRMHVLNQRILRSQWYIDRAQCMLPSEVIPIKNFAAGAGRARVRAGMSTTRKSALRVKCHPANELCMVEEVCQSDIITPCAHYVSSTCCSEACVMLAKSRFSLQAVTSHLNSLEFFCRGVI